MTPQRVLVIDDDVEIGKLFAEVAERLGISCEVVTRASDFLRKLTPEIALVVVDLMMPEVDGVELLRLMGERKCSSDVLLMSGMGNRVVQVAEELGATLGLRVVGRLNKPFRVAELERILLSEMEIQATTSRSVMESVVISDEDLGSAIEHEDFILHYQPQIEMRTSRCIGVEALVRWQHPELGIIYPNQFISRLEGIGLIDELGWIVAKRALFESRRFSEANGVQLQVSINVSPLTLGDLWFPDLLAELANQNEIPLSAITIEITETGLLREAAHALDVLLRLRIKGVRLSIDDFGTGYAMMQQLRDLPATELKIDKTFIQRMDTSASDRLIVDKTIEMGHELGMIIVAEGVETMWQFDFLRNKGCDIAQGFLFSRGLHPKEIELWLRRWRVHGRHT